MFILLLQESPFYSENLSELFRMIINEPIEWKWYKNDLSADAISLLSGLLEKDVSSRLGCGPEGIDEIKKHPFFASTDFDELLTLKPATYIQPKLRVCRYLLLTNV